MPARKPSQSARTRTRTAPQIHAHVRMSEDTLSDLQVLRVEEAMQLLQISRTHLWRLVRSGALPTFTMGRSRRILRADLANYIARLRAETSGDHQQFGVRRGRI